MKTLLAIAVIAALAGGCRKKVPQVDAAEKPAPQNAMTGYVGGLQSSVEKAHSAADKANAAIEARKAQALDPSQP